MVAKVNFFCYAFASVFKKWYHSDVVANDTKNTERRSLMFNISLNEDELKTIYLEEVQKRLEDWEQQTLLMDMKELCKMLSLSRPTVEKLFIYNPHFPSMRVGKKWLFNRKEVEEYINHWSKDVRKKGGVIE